MYPHDPLHKIPHLLPPLSMPSFTPISRIFFLLLLFSWSSTRAQSCLSCLAHLLLSSAMLFTLSSMSEMWPSASLIHIWVTVTAFLNYVMSALIKDTSAATPFKIAPILVISANRTLTHKNIVWCSWFCSVCVRVRSGPLSKWPSVSVHVVCADP